jgi:hypothetical protein
MRSSFVPMKIRGKDEFLIIIASRLLLLFEKEMSENQAVTENQEEEIADYPEEEYNQEYEEEGAEGYDTVQAEDVEKSVQEMEAELEQLTRQQNQVFDQLAKTEGIDENSMCVILCYYITFNNFFILNFTSISDSFIDM